MGGAWVSCSIPRNSSLPELTWAASLGRKGKEDRLPSSSLPLACVPVCAREYECARAEAFLRLRCLVTAGAIGKATEWGRGLPDPRRSRARAAEASREPQLLARGGRCGRPPGPRGPSREELGRRPELHGVSRARNSNGASATGLRGAARQPRTWAEPARRGSARPARAGGVVERAVPGCGANVPRREPRTRTGRHAPRSRSEPTRGSRRLGARLGSRPGRRGSRRQRGCRRADAAAGWGCERAAERCPPAPASAPPPPCGPLRDPPPAPCRGASEPRLRGCGPARSAPAQLEVSAASRSFPPLVSSSRLPPPSSLLSTVPRARGCRGPLSPEWAGGRPTTPPIPVGPGRGLPGSPQPPCFPWGGSWTPARGREAGEGPRVFHLGVLELCGQQVGNWAPGRWEKKEGHGSRTAAQVRDLRGFQVFGKPGVMAIRQGGRREAGGRIPSTSSP